MSRRYARESTMKLLYQMEIHSDFSNNIIDVFFENNKFSLGEKEYIEDAMYTIIDNLKSIDMNIKDNIKGWEIYRLAKIDLCILRIAIYEIIYREDIPVEVSINEAIEVAKTYSTDVSSKFINGVLGGFVRRKNKND